jgi:hypothetical protein
MNEKWIKARRLISQLLFWMLILSNSNNALAGPPFLTDDPEPVDYGHWEFYLFSTLDKNIIDEKVDVNAPALEFNYGALPNIQLHLIVPYALSLPMAGPSNNGIGDIETGIKYRFIQETNNMPQVGIFPLFELPTGNANRNLGNGKLWMKLPIWIQKSWESWTSYGGAGYVINPAKDMRDYPYAGWLLQKKLNEKLTLGGEVFSQEASSINNRSFTVLNAGGFYNFTNNFSLLFSAGHSIIGEQHMIAYVGLLWTRA